MNLIDRIGSDTIGRIERAAPRRLAEAIHLADRGHHLAAIYLCGYAAEMTIGAAYFKLLEYASNYAISEEDRRTAINKAKGPHYRQLSEKLHPLDGWPRLLVEEKRALAPPGYTDSFGQAVIARVDSIACHWCTKLRYRDFEAAESQSREVIEATRWLVENYPNM